MKKYIVFAISFVVFLGLCQILSGAILTTMYTPDISEAWNMSANLPQEVNLIGDNTSSLIMFTSAFLSASLAYFIPKKVFKLK